MTSYHQQVHPSSYVHISKKMNLDMSEIAKMMLKITKYLTP